jgi:CubicO group peptidase (beta-lactamase class C family)
MLRNAIVMLWMSTLFALVGLFAAAACAEDELAERIDAAVPAAFSGQIAIGTPTAVLFSASYGLADREAAAPVTNAMLFDIGSVTKTYTATALLKLVERGRVDVTDTLGAYFNGLNPATAAITVHQLLTHTSGLPLYSGDDREACDTACFDAWLVAVEPEFPPGEKFEYSNPGYSALARIIERVSGRPYETFLQDELAGPLQLGAIGYVQLPESAGYATGYLGDQRIGEPRDLDWAPDGPPWHLRGNGGLLTNAEGLLRWLQATAAGRTLPAQLQERQFSRHALRRENAWYGYGWTIMDEGPRGTVVDHTGGNGFFFADARWLRDRDWLIAITSNAFDREVAETLLAGVVEALSGSHPDTRE